MEKKIRNILIIIVVLMFWLYIYNQNAYSSKLAQNWNDIKSDFEIINSVVIDFFANNNDNMINVYDFKKKLNNNQLIAFENVESNYQKYGDYGGKITNIEFHDEIIEYYDWERYGQFEKIVYTKHTKKELEKIYNKGERHFYIESLGNNWFYLDEHHL